MSAPSATAKAVSAGDQFSLALRSNGTVAASGADTWGQVSGAGAVSNATAISAGYNHGLALRADGFLFGWGRGFEGQLSGIGSGGYTAIDAGGYHSLALRTNGTVAAWGYNDFGQVSGAAGVSGAVAISAGLYHSLALRGNGTVAAWGHNGAGQVSGASSVTNAVSVSAGEVHSVALRSNGTIAAWGANGFGQTSTGGISNAVYAIAGGNHTYFVLRNGSISSVGESLYGQRNTPNGFSLPTTVRWNAAVSGDYLNSHLWDGRIPSTALSTAEFTKAGNYTISFGNTAEAHGLNVTAGVVNFSQATHQYLAKAVTVSSGASFRHNGALSSNVVVDNYGNYEVLSGGSLSTAELNNRTGGTVVNSGTVNGGAITNASSATMYSWGSLSGSTLNNSGIIESWDSISLTGVLTNSSGATIVNRSTLNGTTLDNDGSLVISSGAQANFNTITGAGSIVNNGSLSGTIALDAGGRLSGSGSYSGTLEVANGAVVAPGNSVGLMTGNNSIWDGGGAFEFEINDAMGLMGGLSGWDYLQLIGSLNLTATNADPFLINIKSLNGPVAPGLAANFNSAQSYSWIFASATGGISGFDSSKFQLNYSSFMNSLDGGHFSISQNGNNLSLNFITAVPEPSSLLLVCGGLVLCLSRRHRKTGTMVPNTLTNGKPSL